MILTHQKFKEFQRPLIKKEVDKRTNFLMGFIGTNRTGKSATARMVAEEWRKSRPDNYIVASFDPQGRFADLSDFIIKPDDKDWAKRLCKLRNALVILDDYKIINPNNVPVAGLENLIYYRAHYNIDIMYICHNPFLILNYLTYFTTHYYIFYTQATDGRFESKIPNAQLCLSASRYVNKYVLVHGRGAHPKSPEYKGQAFPYMVVDCENQKLRAYNMSRELPKL
jgi:hypothetical protein